MLDKFFKLKENGTKVSTEVLAGFTTFFAMAYIMFVNPMILGAAGTDDNPFPAGAIFLATIIAAAIGTLVMGLFANVPYAQAPGMGLNAFFTFTVCMGLKFTWQQALAMVFLCGIINIIITITKIRKSIIKSIPVSLQHAIGGGIGIFIAYIGLLKVGVIGGETVGLINFGAGVPGLTDFDQPVLWLALFGLVLTLILVARKVKGAILIGIIATSVIGVILAAAGQDVGINLKAVTFNANDFQEPFVQLGTTFGAAFGKEGIQSLFSDAAKIPLVLSTIFAFSLSDTFDTIGTFIGTGRRTGIFSEADQKALEEGAGFKSKMDKALFADSIATSIGAVFGTSNTTTYVESAAGIEAGGRTGLTSVVTALLFIVSMVISPFLGLVPTAATAPALVAVGIMMMGAFKDIDWAELTEAIPAFFAGIFMALCYSISYGIAFGFIFYCIVKVVKGKAKEVHPILWVASLLFVLNFVILALLK